MQTGESTGRPAYRYTSTPALSGIEAGCLKTEWRARCGPVVFRTGGRPAARMAAMLLCRAAWPHEPHLIFLVD